MTHEKSQYVHRNQTLKHTKLTTEVDHVTPVLRGLEEALYDLYVSSVHVLTEGGLLADRLVHEGLHHGTQQVQLASRRLSIGNHGTLD